jgi:isoquinoline 1-oxidoreductase beta subunit
MTRESTPATVARPSRRAVLTAGAAAGGGLLLGFNLPAEGAVPAAFQPNAFIRMDPSGRVTLTMPQQEMGQGIYTALAQLLADEMDVPFSAVSVEAAPPNDLLYGSPKSHVQSTGGSQSIRTFYLPMRKAGASARTMLVQAAALGWKVDAATCRTADGAVLHEATGRRIAYAALARQAAKLKPPTDAPLKAAKDLKLIGRSVRRLDTPDKVTGKAVYGIDLMPGKVKVAALMAAPVVGGRLVRVETARAMATPGVRQVVVLDDLVAVVADHTWAATQGLAALAITWNDGPNATMNSAQIWRELRATSARKGAVAHMEGDVDKALSRGERLDAAYELPLLAHAPMEPLNCTVHVRPGGCEIWMGTQVQTRAQTAAAKALGLPPEKVVLHNYMLGGAFGRRLDVDMVTKAVRIGQKVDGPVKVLWTREEDMRQDVYRPAYRNVMAASLERGKIVGWTHKIAAGSVAARMSGKPPKGGVDRGSVDGAVEMPYSIPNRRVEYVQAEPRAVRLGYWRGVGPNNTIFAIESFVDELAHKAGQDPVAFRLAMLDSSPRLGACLKLAAQKAGWGGALPRGVGRGVCVQNVFGSYMATVCEVEVDGDGDLRVRRYVTAVDAGSIVNPDTVVAQIEGGLMFGLSAALYGDITVDRGRVVQSNFNNYRVLRITEAPPVAVHLIRSGAPPGGIGEPGTTAAAPSLANAIHAATGVRLRRLPVDRDVLAGRKKA